MWPEEAVVTRVTVITGQRRRHPRFHVHRPLPTHPTPLVHKLSSRFLNLYVYVISISTHLRYPLPQHLATFPKPSLKDELSFGCPTFQEGC